MKPERIYEKYINKAEKNSTNDSFSTDRDKFASLYNENSTRLIKFFLNNRNLDVIKDIQVLLVNDRPLAPEQSKKEYSLFPLPKDFLSWSYMSALASTKKCKDVSIKLFEIRDEDRADVMTSSFFSPSFAYRECPYNFTENFVKVYKEQGMDITKVMLSYYKYPKQIQLQDPENPESNFVDIDIELPEHIIDRIVSAMVGDFKINNSDPAFEVEKMRQNENIA